MTKNATDANFRIFDKTRLVCSTRLYARRRSFRLRTSWMQWTQPWWLNWTTSCRYCVKTCRLLRLEVNKPISSKRNVYFCIYYQEDILNISMHSSRIPYLYHTPLYTTHPSIPYPLYTTPVLPRCMLGYPPWIEWMTDRCENIILRGR